MMVRVLIACVSLAVLPARAQGVEEAVRHFDEGNRLFNDGDFNEARERYRAALDAGYASGALYYNMGNAYFRLDEIGQAIRYYERARRWMPESTELAHNLTMAREQTLDTFSRLPEPFWQPAWNRVVRLLSPAGLFLVGVVFYVAAAAAVALRIRRGRSAWRRRTALAGGLLAVCFLCLGFRASYEQTHRVRAVVLNDQVTLLDRPQGSGADVQVHEGTIVDVVARRAEWSEVRLPNGVRGWIRSDAYGVI